MVDWTHGVTALATGVIGVISGLLGTWFWARQKNNSIANQEAKDAYEMDKLRKSDLVKELMAYISELKADKIVQDKKIDALHDEGITCARKSAMQDAKIYEQGNIISFLEKRLLSLEQLAMPGPAITAAAAQAAALVKSEAAQVAASLASDGIQHPVQVEITDNQRPVKVEVVTPKGGK